ncbi:MAG: class IV adenylate cyclase [Phycisphaeraceae bacterium]|nr:class IV adenylate cyclase [Phycisphaeraceae bacterium]
MGLEIEAKVAVEDLGTVEAALSAHGGVRGRAAVEENLFFDTREGTLKSMDQGLRVRVCRPAGGRGKASATITHKGPRARGVIKSREEIELEISDAAVAGELFARLGFNRVFSFEKKRQSWTLDGCRVELDSLPYVGDFVEVEGSSEQAVLAVMKKLGLDTEALVQASYISLLSVYVSEHRLGVDEVRFG